VDFVNLINQYVYELCDVLVSPWTVYAFTTQYSFPFFVSLRVDLEHGLIPDIFVDAPVLSSLTTIFPFLSVFVLLGKYFCCY
jgi:hypothetical protein